jgi:transcriptional antiterminator Rof (Rho-off)
MTTWVPQSCTLPTAEQPLRVAAFDALFAERLAGASRPDRLRLELVLRGGEGVEGTVRDLVARESGCCSFLTFTVHPGPQEIRLDVAVDDAHEAVLDALEERVTAVTVRDTP